MSENMEEIEELSAEECDATDIDPDADNEEVLGDLDDEDDV